MAGSSGQDLDYELYLASMATLCKCCPLCSQVLCAGVAAGGFCDGVCYCDEREEEWDDDDEAEF